MPWANGRGTTLEIATFPAAARAGGVWAWRLSVAAVNEDGPFSALPGVDRALVVGQGRAMELTVDGVPHHVERYQAIEFSGDADVRCSLPDGPLRDLNLMVRRGHGFGRPELRVERVATGTTLDLNGAVAVVVLDGVLTLTTSGGAFPFTPTRERVTRFDAVLAALETTPTAEPAAAPTLTATRDAVVAFALVMPIES